MSRTAMNLVSRRKELFLFLLCRNLIPKQSTLSPIEQFGEWPPQARTLITSLSDKRSNISEWIHNVSLEGVGVKAKPYSSFGGYFQEGDEIEIGTGGDSFELGEELRRDRWRN